MFIRKVPTVCSGVVFFFVICVITLSAGQSEVTFPINFGSFRQILRSKTPVPEGRIPKLEDVRIKLYWRKYKLSNHSSEYSSSSKTYWFRNLKKILSHPKFNFENPTVLYSHGYVELTSDESVRSVVSAHLARGGSNVLVLDWANLAFGDYLQAALSVQPVGAACGDALGRLAAGGLRLPGLHLVGHSLGAHVAAAAARALRARGLSVPRITGLDPALPGFTPGWLGVALGPGDAAFVDVLHTDGGRYGTPAPAGHADFWPNSGGGKQPGCEPNSLLLTYEDFCSHWRSWRFWAESVRGGRFSARRCRDYDAFLRGRCPDQPLALMGLAATSDLRGNYYLRTASSPPFALGDRGAL